MNRFEGKVEERLGELVKQRKKVKLMQLQKDVFELIADKKKNPAIELLVEHFENHNFVYTLRDDDKPEMWIYRDGIYVPEGKTYVKDFCRRILNQVYSSYYGNRVIERIETDTYVSSQELFKEENPDLICVENGVFDLKTKKLLEHSPDYKFFNKIPVIYDPKKKCPNIEAFLKSVISQEGDLPLFYEIFGFCLRREYAPEKAIMFVGGGRNGKGKTLDLLRRFLGVKNCAEVSLARIETDKFSTANLHKKLANVAGDIDSTSLKNTAQFKGLTGRDLKTAEKKFRQPFEFENYAKLIFCANVLPKSYDVTQAFMRRWVLYEFNTTFVNEKEYEGTADKTNLKIADPDIISKVISKDEMSGLFNKAIDGLLRLRKNKDFSYSKSADDVKRMWIRKSDSFMSFCLDCIEESQDAQISKDELRRIYTKYCKKYKVKAEGDKLIRETLTREFGVWENQEARDMKRYWNDIKFKKNYTDFLVRKSKSQGQQGISFPIQKNNHYKESKTSVIPVISFIGRFTTINGQPPPLWILQKEFGDEILTTLEDLKKKGEVFEPMPGRWKVV